MVSRWYLSDITGSCFLSTLCSTLLQCALPKEQGVRTSAWQSALIPQQARTPRQMANRWVLLCSVPAVGAKPKVVATMSHSLVSLHSFLSPQVGYDARAGVLLLKDVIANADPIHFSAPPKASELVQGKRILLYTKSSHAFVAFCVIIAPLQGTVERVTVGLTSNGVRPRLRPVQKATGASANRCQSGSLESMRYATG